MKCLVALNWCFFWIVEAKIMKQNADSTCYASSKEGHPGGKKLRPKMSCIVCTKKRKNTRKNASFFFLSDSGAPLCFPCYFKKVSYIIHIYTFWLANPANQRKSLHVLVLVTNFYIVNVG